MPPWRTLVWFKFTEMVLQCRPKSLWRTFLHPDPALRHAMHWYSRMGRRVWPREIADFLRDDRLHEARLWQLFGARFSPGGLSPDGGSVSASCPMINLALLILNDGHIRSRAAVASKPTRGK
jgi:hypothetical protein